jgi:hypothetical protein
MAEFGIDRRFGRRAFRTDTASYHSVRPPYPDWVFTTFWKLCSLVQTSSHRRAPDCLRQPCLRIYGFGYYSEDARVAYLNIKMLRQRVATAAMHSHRK